MLPKTGTMLPEAPPERHAPLTVQVCDRIRRGIVRGRLAPDGYLPSVRKLADAFNVSSNIVFLALRQLRDEALIRQTPNGRHVVNTDRPSGSAAGLRRLAFCSCGVEHIRHGVYQSVYNRLEQICRQEQVDFECLLELGFHPETELQPFDALVVADWKPEQFRRCSAGPVIGLDTWRGVDVDVTVKTNHHQGGWLAGSLMYREGRRKVVYWDVIPAKAVLLRGMALRYLGFQKGWIEAGGSPEDITALPVFAGDSDPRGLIAEFSRQADGFFGYCDECAMLLWHELKLLGVKVPDDIAIVGFDGSYEALSHDPPLTTIRHDTAELARTLFRCCEKPPDKGTEILIEPVLCPGASI